MKKIAIAITMVFTFIFVSCTEDTNELNEAAADVRLATPEIDTNIGTYKGIFTTNDAEYRGIVEIKLANYNASSLTESLHKATITMQNGDIAFATSNDVVTEGQLANRINFTSNDISFSFSVNADGSEPKIKNVIYKNVASDIIIAKHTNRAPVISITGTFEVITTEIGTYPISGGQTFNLMFVAGASTGTSVQTTFNGVAHNSTNGVSENCNNYTTGYDICDISGSFTIGNAPANFYGTHKYSTTSLVCSTTIGSWDIQTATWGRITGTFLSDPGATSCGVDFNNAVNVNFNTFRGLGFAPVPVAGQLNSNYFIATGFSDGDSTYGGTSTAGDFARGEHTGGVTTGGVYAFQVEPGNYTLGVQAGGSDFTLGTFEMQIPNTSANNKVNFGYSYSVYSYNDKNGSQGLKVFYSSDGIMFYPVEPATTDFTTPETADGSPAWVETLFAGNFSAFVPVGESLYIRFAFDDAFVVSGQQRDEMAIDNLVIFTQI